MGTDPDEDSHYIADMLDYSSHDGEAESENDRCNTDAKVEEGSHKSGAKLGYGNCNIG